MKPWRSRTSIRTGGLDIISGESWYEAPGWTKHPLREIEFNANYVDNFTDLALDVDGDGWVDVVQFGYFSSKIVWLKNPGKRGGAWSGQRNRRQRPDGIRLPGGPQQ